MAVVLALGIAAAGSYQAIGITRQLLPLESHERLTQSVEETGGRAPIYNFSLAERIAAESHSR